MLTYAWSNTNWFQLAARRLAALSVDGMIAASLMYAVSLFLSEAAIVENATKLLLPGSIASFFLLRTAGISLGMVVFDIQIANDGLSRRLVRTAALFVPGYNLIDWAHAMQDPEHRTLTEKLQGVRVLDARYY